MDRNTLSFVLQHTINLIDASIFFKYFSKNANSGPHFVPLMFNIILYSTFFMAKEKISSLPGQREQSKEKRRAAIIEIAKRSFLEKGYENTSMSAIAVEMGGSKGTLWTYFTSKEELFSAVLENIATVFQSSTAMTLNTEQDTATVLTRFCETFIGRIST